MSRARSALGRAGAALVAAALLSPLSCVTAAAREPASKSASLVDAVSSCYPVSTIATHVPGGSAPYIELAAGGRTGRFLIDWGATASSVGQRHYPQAKKQLRVDDFSLPGFSSGTFEVFDYNLKLEPPGGQAGIVGTDFLSLMSIRLVYGRKQTRVSLGTAACDPGLLSRSGYVAIDQAGYYSHDVKRVPTRPNVPVLFLDIGGIRAAAQIDSGYEDISRRHSIDINKPLHDALVAKGLAVSRSGKLEVGTCAGRETRPVLALPGTPIKITTASGEAVRKVAGASLILKAPNACGGIADMAEPAAQIGASLLRTLGEIIVDGRTETVWLRRPSRPD
jgi:hypothetical protein